MKKYQTTKTFGHDKGYSCAFRQWNAKTNCKYLHGYSLGFKITLEAINLDDNNWVYDFGGFDFLKKWLAKNFDHKLLIDENDPDLEFLRTLDEKDLAQVNIIPKISCEYFAEMTFGFIKQHLSNQHEIKVVSVEVSEHNANTAAYFE